jgi:hypothetical protein
MAAPKYNASIENRYWFEDSVARAWPPGADVFTGENNPKANYALDVNIDGQVMTFIPNSVIQNGVYNPFSDTRVSGKSYTLPWFLDAANQEKLKEVGKKIDLSNSDVGKYLKDRMGASTDGVLVPRGSIPFDSQIADAPGRVTGIGSIQGQNVYLNEDTNNQGRTFFIDPAGTRRELLPGGGGGGGFGGFLDDLFGGAGDLVSDITGGISDFGSGVEDFVSDTYMDVRDPLQAAAVVAGNYFVPGSSLITSNLVSNEAQEMLSSDIGIAANLAAGVSGGIDGNSIFSGTDPNAVGGVTGPDNIDVGGGFNPAAGYIPPEGVISSPVYSPELPVGVELPPLPEPTLDEIIAELGTPAATNPAYAADNIDVGGGFNPATGTGDAATAAAAAANPPIYYPPVEIGPELLGEAGGNTFPPETPPEGLEPIELGDATPSVSNAVYDYGDATPAEIVKAKELMGLKGFTFSQALNAVRAGLLVNALTGDPLGLAGDTGSGNTGGGDTGFAIVPVPAEWRSPTYAASAAPMDINSLFTNMNLLGGTQWQGLPTQKPNLSFNDIFASGQQRTPMGTPVDINQIVSAILGQNTAGTQPT